MLQLSIADLSERLSSLSTKDEPNDEATNVHHRAQSSTSSLTHTQPASSKLELGPIEHLAYYSCSEAGDISFDLSCLRPFRQPTLPRNLLKGRELFHNRNMHNRSVGHPVPLDNLVRACVALGQEAKLRSADVVTWRGLLTKLMLNGRVDLKFWTVDGVLYLLEYDKEPHIIHHKQLLRGYHGYAFEALCTSPTDAIELPTLDVWKCIVRRTFGDLDVVFGAEVDCVRGAYGNTSENLMELKTESVAAHESPKGNDYKKRKKWYFQSHLMDIPEICVGYRDDDFILHKMESIPLERVYNPSEARMADAFTFVYQALQRLRAFCSTALFMQQPLSETGHSKVWQVGVQRGSLLGQPRPL